MAASWGAPLAQRLANLWVGRKAASTVVDWAAGSVVWMVDAKVLLMVAHLVV